MEGVRAYGRRWGPLVAYIRLPKSGMERYGVAVWYSVVRCGVVVVWWCGAVAVA